MSDTANTGDSSEPAESVLRPYEPAEPPPLPPVESSRVVPDVPVATEVPSAVDELEPIEALADEPFSVDTTDYDDGWSPSGIDPVEAASAPVVPAPPVNVVSVDDLNDPLLADDHPAIGSDRSGPAGGPTDDDSITVPRSAFLLGLGSVAAVMLLLVVLWQTAGDDGGPAAVAGDADVDADVALDPPPDPVDTDTAPDPVDTDTPSTPDPGVADTLAAELAEAEATVASLEKVVTELESRPPPALPGSAMRRIVVGGDANFVSALDGSVAVVGTFGSLQLIDPATNRVSATGDVGTAANRVLRTPTSVWVTNYQDGLVVQVDPGTNTVARLIAIPGPDGIAKDGDTLVVASFDEGFVARVDPTSGEVVEWVDVGGRPTAVHRGDHGLWVAVFDTGELVRIDPDSFDIVERVVVGAGPVGISADATHLWVTNNDEGTVAKVDPETAEVVFTVAVGEGPAEVVSVEGSAWVTVSDDGTLVQLDTATGEILTVTPLGGAIAGGGPTGIDFADGALWIAVQGEQSVVRIDI